jgi:hypothetical protein
MFVHGAEFFLFKPGIVLFLMGLLLTLPMSLGPVTIGPVSFSLYTMLIGVTLTALGVQSIFFGCLAHVFLDYSEERALKWRRMFSYTRTVITSAVIFLVGAVLVGVLVVSFFSHGYSLQDPANAVNHLGVVGLMLTIIGFSTFCFTLLLHATAVRYGAPGDE